MEIRTTQYDNGDKNNTYARENSKNNQNAKLRRISLPTIIIIKKSRFQAQSICDKHDICNQSIYAYKATRRRWKTLYKIQSYQHSIKMSVQIVYNSATVWERHMSKRTDMSESYDVCELAQSWRVHASRDLCTAEPVTRWHADRITNHSSSSKYVCSSLTGAALLIWSVVTVLMAVTAEMLRVTIQVIFAASLARSTWFYTHPRKLILCTQRYKYYIAHQDTSIIPATRIPGLWTYKYQYGAHKDNRTICTQ